MRRHNRTLTDLVLVPKQKGKLSSASNFNMEFSQNYILYFLPQKNLRNDVTIFVKYLEIREYISLTQDHMLNVILK